MTHTRQSPTALGRAMTRGVCDAMRRVRRTSAVHGLNDACGVLRCGGRRMCIVIAYAAMFANLGNTPPKPITKPQRGVSNASTLSCDRHLCAVIPPWQQTTQHHGLAARHACFYTKRTLSVPNCTEQSDRSAGLAASDRRIGGASSDPEGHALGYYVVGKRTRTFSYVDVRRTLAATSTRRLTPPDWTESHNMRTLQAAGPSVSEASRHAEFRKRTSLNAVSRLDYRTQYLHAHATLCYRMCW